MRKLLVGMIMVWSIGAVVNAAEIAGQPVDVTFDVTYACKYVWRGFNLFGSRGAIQPSVDLALENGLSFNVWASYPIGSNFNYDATEYDYTVAYGSTAFEDCPWKTNYTVGWRYYDFIGLGSENYDQQELFIEMEMPELMDNGIVPHIAYYYMWNAKSGMIIDGTGSILVAGLGYDFTLDQAPELPMSFTWDIVYNDEVLYADSGVTHMLWGLSTEMQCPMTGATITPAIYFQNSMEDQVNQNDELFGTISYTLSF